MTRVNRLILAVVAPLLSLSVAQTATAQVAPATSPSAPTISTQHLQIAVGRSTTIETPWPAKRISVTDPKIADIQAISPRQVLVSGKALGNTDVLVWNAEDEAREYQVDVGLDTASTTRELARLFPGSELDVHQSGGVLVVTGSLDHAEDSERLRRFLESSGTKYVDLTRLPGVQQVQIKVMVAEADRTAIRSLGINAVQVGNNAFGASTIGPDSGGALQSLGAISNSGIGSVSVSPAVTLFGGIPSSKLDVFVQALAENQYLRVLSEPTLSALSGQEASFLAGGEFPIPVVQGGGASTSGSSITIDYKEFGVRLRFKPTVLGNGAIQLHVAPEVSELSNGIGAVQIQGFSLPSILTRKAETTIEMNSGQTFGMAGLISQNTQARASSVPGLGEIPVIGALFRSVRYQQGDTELLIMVTASLVDPLSVEHAPPAPGFTHSVPNDWEVYALGRIDGQAPAKLSDSDQMWLKESGLQKLHGPGAWAEYDTPAASASVSK